MIEITRYGVKCESTYIICSSKNLKHVDCCLSVKNKSKFHFFFELNYTKMFTRLTNSRGMMLTIRSMARKSAPKFDRYSKNSTPAAVIKVEEEINTDERNENKSANTYLKMVSKYAVIDEDGNFDAYATEKLVFINIFFIVHHFLYIFFCI